MYSRRLVGQPSAFVVLLESRSLPSLEGIFLYLIRGRFGIGSCLWLSISLFSNRTIFGEAGPWAVSLGDTSSVKVLERDFLQFDNCIVAYAGGGAIGGGGPIHLAGGG